MAAGELGLPLGHPYFGHQAVKWVEHTRAPKTWSSNVRTKSLEAAVSQAGRKNCESEWLLLPTPSAELSPAIGEGFTLHLPSYLLPYFAETVYCAQQASP